MKATLNSQRKPTDRPYRANCFASKMWSLKRWSTDGGGQVHQALVRVGVERTVGCWNLSRIHDPISNRFVRQLQEIKLTVRFSYFDLIWFFSSDFIFVAFFLIFQIFEFARFYEVDIDHWRFLRLSQYQYIVQSRLSLNSREFIKDHLCRLIRSVNEIRINLDCTHNIRGGLIGSTFTAAVCGSKLFRRYDLCFTPSTIQW